MPLRPGTGYSKTNVPARVSPTDLPDPGREGSRSGYRLQQPQIRKEYPCKTLEELLETVAANLSTKFIEIHTDEELKKIKKDFLGRGETSFARLDDLNGNVFAITFRLLLPRPWDRRYLSLIDCRGPRAARAYFSKWHELAHLLTQTNQMRLVFTRTHAQLNIVDPEEALMEQIAGAVGFLPTAEKQKSP